MSRVPLVVLAALLLSGCEGEPPPSRAETNEGVVAFSGLCRTMELVEQGNLTEARRVFTDQSHAYIHEMAAAGLDAVPGPTAALLENKGIVEEALDHPGRPEPGLLQALFDLQRAFRALSEELGREVPPPCAGTAA